MNESVTQQKVTIQEAAQTLNISRKTIYRWIERGLISKVKEESKTYVLLSEVKAVCDKGIQKDTEFVSEIVSDTKHDTSIVTIDRQHYEGLLIKLGQYEAERRYLLEYKGGLEAKDKELIEARAIISKARSELEKMIEFKQESEKKARALMEREAQIEQKNKELADLQTELERARLPWWKRLWKK